MILCNNIRKKRIAGNQLRLTQNDCAKTFIHKGELSMPKNEMSQILLLYDLFL